MKTKILKLGWVALCALSAETAAWAGAYHAWYVPLAISWSVGMATWIGRL